MSPERLAEVRADLVAEQRRLRGELDRLEALGPARPPDVVDQAELALEASTVADRRRRAGARLGEIVAALGRLEDGTLDRCGTCGGPIDDERLELVPTTTTCREDAGARVAS